MYKAPESDSLQNLTANWNHRDSKMEEKLS